MAVDQSAFSIMPVLRTFLLLTILPLAPALAEKSRKPFWNDPVKAEKEDPDFSIQGEYSGTEDGQKVGLQVIARGSGRFDATLYQGGLPGQGYDRTKAFERLNGRRKEASNEILLHGKDGLLITISPSQGVTLVDKIKGREARLIKVNRQSPTLGQAPPAGGIQLFSSGKDAQSSMEQNWSNGKLRGGFLLANNIKSKQRFGSHQLHLEFRPPYRPFSSGQGRGNSGLYLGARWEVQILDSFGLAGRDNECGGIYKIAAPRVNACLPPLNWQTYDVDYTGATFDENGTRLTWPTVTIHHNGILIHDQQPLWQDFTTAAPEKGALKPEKRPVFLQKHGNPVLYRNIWVVEK